MGSIEISDGVSSRTIPTGAFAHAIRIEASAADGLRVIVPEGVSVDSLETPD